MFMHLLHPSQQTLLIKTAEVLIASDKVIADEEARIVEILKSQATSPLQPIEKFELSSLKNSFSNRKEKIAFLFELVAVALIDEEFHANERSLITEIAELISVSDIDLKQIEEWVLQQMGLQKSAEKMMGI